MNRAVIILLLLFPCVSSAQDFQYYPGATYDPSVPTLQQVVGHDWGEKITMHHELERYIFRLAEASPKVQVVKYGETWEGRSLYYLIVASEKNMARVDEIKAGTKALADPRRTQKAEADRLIRDLPAVTWLTYAVHGNEISGTDAATLTAYHLVASQNDTLAQLILDQSVVIIDPLQNADGRDRFINYFRQTRGPWPDEDQQAAEHREVWPGGRGNHYLFDMNRDWFALTQIETHGKVKAYLDWYPVVFVDLHEMGSNSTYYFAPPADPINPEVPKEQSQLWVEYGRNNAAWFDRFGFDYFTREIFDSFYPGYGEGWPLFHGSIGMTYEQASSRGLVVRKEDETVMHFRNTVQHHFIASLSTCQTTARSRERMLRYFYDYRRSAIDEGERGGVKEYIIPPGKDPNRAAKLAALLRDQGIEVSVAGAAFSNGSVKDYYSDKRQEKRFPAGTYVIPTAQPSKRLLTTLMARQIEIEKEFLQEQLRREKKRLPNQIYDVTGWSLPLLFDVECYEASRASGASLSPFTGSANRPDGITGGKASVAYLIPWGTNSAARTLAALFRKDIRVHQTDKAFTLEGRLYPPGTLIIKVKDNPEDLHETLTGLVRSEGVSIVAAQTAWVEDGVNFGSNEVNFLKKPKVAMAYNTPVSSYSAGWTRFLLERAYGYPVTIIHADQLARADLTKYNVLILPDSWGGYGSTFGESGAGRLKDWIQQGGTLVTYGAATHWLTQEKTGLLSTTRELRGGKPDAPEKKEDDEKKKAEKEPKPDLSRPFDLEKHILPDKELPAAAPGVIMRITLDPEHWLAFGYDGGTNVLIDSRNIFTPIKLDKGRNVGLFEDESKLVLSGFLWEDTQKQLAKKAYLLHQAHGRGHVVGFADDPNSRAFVDGTNLLFLNAVFFGPAH